MMGVRRNSLKNVSSDNIEKSALITAEGMLGLLTEFGMTLAQ